MNVDTLLIIAANVGLILIATLFFLFKHTKRKVIENSLCIKELKDYNATFSFNSNVKPIYNFLQFIHSRRDFNRLSLDECLNKHIIENFDFYSELVFNIDYNNQNRKLYIEGAKERLSLTDKRVVRGFTSSPFLFRFLEIITYKKFTLNPPMESTINIKLIYKTPSGKNVYSKSYMYHFLSIKQTFNRIAEERKYKQSLDYQIRVERSKMTSSLRYDVLRRDNFKCKICGRSQIDGVRLHVDHVYPVSKGGLSVFSNLQTLCDECNMGKSNKT